MPLAVRNWLEVVIKASITGHRLGGDVCVVSTRNPTGVACRAVALDHGSNGGMHGAVGLPLEAATRVGRVPICVAVATLNIMVEAARVLVAKKALCHETWQSATHSS